MNSYRVEASWKLGQWKELENFLKFVRIMYLCNAFFIVMCYLVKVNVYNIMSALFRSQLEAKAGM